MQEKKTVIIVCGPTASGKTDFAVTLAEKYHTSIISSDSRQCYSELNIGVARPSEKILKKVPHYFINSHSIHEEVNARTFEEYALKVASGIFETHEVAIMAGGTGLYIRAFTHGLDNIPEVNQEVENFVKDQYTHNGLSWLQKELKEKDPLFFEKGEMKNPQRMMRALSVKLSTGKSIRDFFSLPCRVRPFNIRKIYLDIPRPVLYDRINRRVDAMVENGLLAEAHRLYPYRHLNALQTVGYSELFEYMSNKISLEEAVRLIKQNTRHYAKRQVTWFKKYFVDAHTEIATLKDLTDSGR